MGSRGFYRIEELFFMDRKGRFSCVGGGKWAILGMGMVASGIGFYCTTGQYFKKAMVSEWKLVYRVEIWRRNRRNRFRKGERG